MSETPTKIFLFVPNLIGYVRIFLFLISFYYMPFDYFKAGTCYFLAVFLDEFDGYFARLFEQETRFGDMLDHLTDVAAPACLFVVLASFYPKYTFWFQISLVIDVVCHWMHSHSCVLQGANSHKDVGTDCNPMLRLYYTSKPFLTAVACSYELFYMMLYLLHFTEGMMVPGLDISIIRLILYISAPIMILKTIICLIHLADASIRIANIDVADRSKKI